MSPNPKRPPLLRDQKYIDAVREMPCILSGETPCDAAHIRFGFYGIGEKPDDYLVLPLSRYLHMEQHAVGEVLFWRAHITSELLMSALKALARERYAEWKVDNKSK